jgi:hypothetical protein
MIGERLSQTRHYFLDAGHGSLVSLLGIDRFAAFSILCISRLVTPFDEGYYHDCLVDVIEHDQGIIKTKVEIGQTSVIVGGVGQVFDVTHDIVSCIPDRPTDERWQFRKFCNRPFSHFLGQELQGIVGLELGDPAILMPLDLIAISDDASPWTDGDKAVPTDLLSTDDTFEETGGTLPIVEQSECTDRSQMVAQKSSIDWDKIVLFEQISKVFKIGKCTHSSFFAR